MSRTSGHKWEPPLTFLLGLGLAGIVLGQVIRRVHHVARECAARIGPMETLSS